MPLSRVLVFDQRESYAETRRFSGERLKDRDRMMSDYEVTLVNDNSQSGPISVYSDTLGKS